jgi:hypothetical protein
MTCVRCLAVALRSLPRAPAHALLWRQGACSRRWHTAPTEGATTTSCSEEQEGDTDKPTQGTHVSAAPTRRQICELASDRDDIDHTAWKDAQRQIARVLDLGRCWSYYPYKPVLHIMHHLRLSLQFHRSAGCSARSEKCSNPIIVVSTTSFAHEARVQLSAPAHIKRRCKIIVILYRTARNSGQTSFSKDFRGPR